MKNPYESDRLLGEYLLFHYGSNDEVMPWEFGPKNGLNFATRTVNELIDKTSISFNGNARALDVGCAVGRSTFELAKHCNEVHGCDLSKSFISTAQTILKEGFLPYRYLEEGDSFKQTELKIENNIHKNVNFFVADACSLPENLGAFDIVHAANLVCRLPEPLHFINRLSDLVSKGGQLLLATPFTWLEEYTPRSKWLGSGDSEKKLAEYLSPFFELEKTAELPFIIREHRRKFQFSVSLGTRWRRIKD